MRSPASLYLAIVKVNIRARIPAGESAAAKKAERQPASVTFLHQLNEVQDGLLLAGTAEGAVRVWRNYAHKAEQRLATAWQVSTVNTHWLQCLPP